MFEVSHSSKNHRNIILVGRINRILIMDRSARLNDRGDAGFVGSLNTISEREEGIGCHHAPRNSLPALTNGIFQCPDSTYLSRTNSRGAFVFCNRNCIRFSMLDNFPCKQQVFQFFFLRTTICNVFQFTIKQLLVHILNQQTSQYGFCFGRSIISFTNI